jgi:hypothetical protein
VRTYQIADLALESAIPLPELPPAPSGGSGWTVAVDPRHRRSIARWSHHWHDAGGRPWLSIGRLDGEHVIRFARTASFRVSIDRRRITCEGAARVPAGSLRHLLLNQVLPLALGCDRIVLHASAVSLPMGAVAFAGPGGAGKSTLAAAIGREGAGLLTDDAVILERGDSGWQARAIYESLRLWPDAAEALFGSRVISAPVARHTGKRRIDVRASSAIAAAEPLAAVCLLSGSRRRPSPISLQRVPAREAVVALTASSFHLDIHDRDRWKRVVEDLACAVEAVPVFSLSYPRRMTGLAATARAVIDRLTAAVPGR